MGSYMNFKYFRDTVQLAGCQQGALVGNYPLARQLFIYSLTFDEFQNTLVGPGKDFGSMNVEDLLKGIWTAEETQAMSSCPAGGDGMAMGGNLQRDAEDHISWPLQHGWHEKALKAVDASQIH